MNFEELIEKRQSIRSFHKKELTAKQQQEIAAYYKQEAGLIPEIHTELFFADKEAGIRLEGIAGYRGNAFMAPAYFLILSEEKEGYLKNAGYLGESLVLKLTDMGLSSCWLTVEHPEVVKKALLIDSPLVVAAVLAVGNGKAERDGMRLDILTPSNIKIENREGHIAPKISQRELAFDKVFHTPMVWEEDQFDPCLDKALYAASLAPAFLNRQNCRYLVKGDRIYLLDGEDAMVNSRDQELNEGISMFHFHIVYSQYMHSGKGWELGSAGDREEMKLPKEYEIIGSYKLW